MPVTRIGAATLSAGIVMFAIGLTACGETTSAPPPETVTVVREVSAPEPAPSPSSADRAPTGSIVVPDVVGRDHQWAQDTMQAAGLYALLERDASGQGRAILWDRNWTVVRQSPKAGTRVDESQTITLYAKKDGE
jgi:hypothetical protein